MFKVKVFKGLLLVAMVFSLALSACAQKVGEEEINKIFDEVVYQKSMLDKAYFEFTPGEVKKFIVPSAVELFKATIDTVREQYGVDITTQDIWNAMAPNVEAALADMRDEIDRRVERLLESRKK